ncbi:MAG: flagellar basal body rod protein FlgB [Deltaproteobacteria bacterium]|nr:flagellar basal body rod protein FlgB [Deltaproteobacteria bacterium]MBW2305576.1 flagellar basal body rod protein FlgB [Deltaproteobacteria bacterium]
MIEGKLFGKTVSLLSKALDLRSLRHRIISRNIANVSTPNYRAMDLRFEEALRSQMQFHGSVALSRTNHAHLAASSAPGIGTGHFIVQNEETKIGTDGNSVDEEMEMVKMAENQLVYQSIIQVLSRKLLSIKSAIQEGGR